MMLIFEKWNNCCMVKLYLFPFFKNLVGKICKNEVLLFVAFIYYKIWCVQVVCVWRVCRIRAYIFLIWKEPTHQLAQCLFLQISNSQILRSKGTSLSHVVISEQKGRALSVSLLLRIPFTSWDILEA